MPATPAKAAAKKAPPKRAPAKKSVAKKRAADDVLEVPFRDAVIRIKESVRTSARVVFAAHLGMSAQLVAELVGPANRVAFIAQCSPGDTPDAVAEEFLAAVAAAVAKRDGGAVSR